MDVQLLSTLGVLVDVDLRQCLREELAFKLAGPGVPPRALSRQTLQSALSPGLVRLWDKSIK